MLALKNIMADIDVVSHVDEVILKTTMALARALEQAGAAAEKRTGFFGFGESLRL